MATSALVNPGFLVDTSMSAQMVRGWTGGVIWQSANALGRSNALDARGLGRGMLFIQNSGNSASGLIVVSPDTNWWTAYSAASAYAIGQTAFIEVSGQFGYWAFSANWISGGVRTATINVQGNFGVM